MISHEGIHGDLYMYLLISHKQSTKCKLIMVNILYMDPLGMFHDNFYFAGLQLGSVCLTVAT